MSGVSLSPFAESTLRARAELPWDPRPVAADAGAEVKRVVLILGSSRGGTSLLFQLLRATGAFASIDGEHVHLYKLHNMGLPSWPQAHDGDIDNSDADFLGFARDLLSDCTIPALEPTEDADRYTMRVVRRLVTQWPGIEIPVMHTWEYIRALARQHRYLSGEFDPVDFHLDLISWARTQGMHIDPWYYDIAADRVTSYFPGLPRPMGPPTATAGLIEEPPFVVTRPATPVGNLLAERPLLLKASLDAYRAEYLFKVFPEADFKIIHLARNPAAAINGLYDGWLDRGFFSHNLTGRAVLGLSDYSCHPWGRVWWKFDLPPGWQHMVLGSLLDVCAFQWRSAHSQILAKLRLWNVPTMFLHAEDLMFASPRRHAMVRAALEFADAMDVADATSSRGLMPEAGVTMASVPPAAGRWRLRAALLTPVLDDPRTRRLSCYLGYGPGPDSTWT